MLPSAVPSFKDAKVIDMWIKRFPQAVTHFAPGSASTRPPQKIPEIDNLVVAGDLVRGLEHGSAGLSQERAYVSGLAAGNQLIKSMGGNSAHEILATEGDEPQFKALKDFAQRSDRLLRAVRKQWFVFYQQDDEDIFL